MGAAHRGQVTHRVRRRRARPGADLVKPITLLSVTALGEPGLLVEVEATAVLE